MFLKFRNRVLDGILDGSTKTRRGGRAVLPVVRRRQDCNFPPNISRTDA